jgi:hypothetical protein
MIMLLHRQLHRCPPDLQLTPGDRFSVCLTIHMLTSPVNVFQVSVTAFTKKRIRVHEAYIACPADSEADTAPLIHIVKHLEVRVKEFSNKSSSATARAHCFNILSHLCYPVTDNILVAKDGQRSLDGIGSATDLHAATSLDDEQDMASTMADNRDRGSVVTTSPLNEPASEPVTRQSAVPLSDHDEEEPVSTQTITDGTPLPDVPTESTMGVHEVPAHTENPSDTAEDSETHRDETPVFQHLR